MHTWTAIPTLRAFNFLPPSLGQTAGLLNSLLRASQLVGNLCGGSIGRWDETEISSWKPVRLLLQTRPTYVGFYDGRYQHDEGSKKNPIMRRLKRQERASDILATVVDNLDAPRLKERETRHNTTL